MSLRFLFLAVGLRPNLKLRDYANYRRRRVTFHFFLHAVRGAAMSEASSLYCAKDFLKAEHAHLSLHYPTSEEERLRLVSYGNYLLCLTSQLDTCIKTWGESALCYLQITIDVSWPKIGRALFALFLTLEISFSNLVMSVDKAVKTKTDFFVVFFSFNSFSCRSGK